MVTEYEVEMARSFGAEERERLHARLLEEGRRLFTRYGIKRSSVDEITDAVGIAKGTFYHFFSSKLELCIALMEEEERAKWKLMEEPPAGEGERGDEVTTSEEPHEAVRRFFRRARNLIAGSELVHAIYRRGEFEYLLRGMTSDYAERNRRGDDAFSEALIERWRGAGVPVSVEPRVLTALFRALFFAALHRDEIGDGAEEAEALLFDAAADAVVSPGAEE
jgi:AcrR family transcriptional regulator